MKIDLKFKPKKPFHRRWRSLWVAIRTGKDRPPRWRRRKSEGSFRAEFSPELEKITNQLIRDTVGIGGALDQEFLRYTAEFDENHPIGEEEAKAVLTGMLKRAIANRELINGRISHAVEFGSMYDRYYAKLQRIYDLNVDTKIRRDEMLSAQQEYFFADNVYRNVRDLTYTPEVIQKNDTEAYEQPPRPASTEGGSP